MISYIWPIALVIVSNIVYNICAKSTPSTMDPFASLTITYIIGAVCAAVFYFLTNRGGNLLEEYSRINWASIALGVVIVGLEVGYIFAYRAGWSISTAATVQSVFVAVGLIAVGALLYREAITWNRLLGVAICVVGLYFINR